ncbi:carbohydrate ABC transporter permease [Rhizobium esperanzae]|uniref:Glucose/mannose transport system permease protein n=1 Tax=Rhizobium esperanzae TaxID=1967781 RepID=A0A7W6R322_9HYPH|nr:carbohydrate ABC transporter permease [Rhizobium esperanzae]MBB4235908.1 glucose/mannose transport system permease protein [Rhizobium esperanzae]
MLIDPEGLPGDKRFTIGKVAIYVCVIAMALVYTLPFIVIVLTSLKDLDDIRTGSILSLPARLTLEPWKLAWDSACISVQCEGLRPYFLNSVTMVIPALMVSTFLGALNGYALTLVRFRGADFVFAVLLFGCFIPYQIVLIPMARVLGFAGMANSIPGLILVHIVYGIPFTTLYFRNFFMSVPHELVQAARMDGAGFFTVFTKILCPIAISCFVVSVIWQFTNIWNDFLFGTTFASGANVPVMVALNNLVNATTGVKAYNVDMAAVLITAAPTLLIYIVSGRYFLRGLMAGSVKG